MAPNLEAPPTIPVPSADLINYRFDQTDKKFEEMSNKLDAILAQNANFTSEEKVDKMIKDAVAPIKDTLISYRWYIRSMFGALALAALTFLFSLLHGGKL